MARLEIRQMFKNPLACEPAELDNVIRYLETPGNEAFRDTTVLPFHADVEHYRSARDVLQKVNGATGQEYKTLGEYFLTVMPNDETRQALEGLLQEQ